MKKPLRILRPDSKFLKKILTPIKGVVAVAVAVAVMVVLVGSSSSSSSSSTY